MNEPIFNTKPLPPPKFDGVTTIKIRFKNKAEYQKFRKYILKTDWEYGDGRPTWEQIQVSFHNVDDLTTISKIIMRLLQLNFDVYCAHYKLEEQMAEQEHPRDDTEEEEDDEININGAILNPDSFCAKIFRLMNGGMENGENVDCTD